MANPAHRFSHNGQLLAHVYFEVRPGAVASTVGSHRSTSDATSTKSTFEGSLRPDCAASGFFQCLVGYGENEKRLVGLVKSVISKAGMVVHGK